MPASDRTHALHPAAREIGVVLVLKAVGLVLLALLFARAEPVTDPDVDQHILHRAL